MEVFHCLTDASVEIPAYNGLCDESPPELKVCSQVLGAWAMGAEVSKASAVSIILKIDVQFSNRSIFVLPQPLTLPPEAGYPIGGPGYNQYVRIEMHYNNPMLKPSKFVFYCKVFQKYL